MASEIDLHKVALRIAHRIRAIAIKENLVPVGRPDPDSPKKTGGELRKSIHVSQTGDGAMVGTNKVYARAVHEGRKAMVIRPKRKKALRWKRGGNFVFAKQVFQPKREGKPFFRNAVDLFEQNLDKEIAGLALDSEMAGYLAANLKKQGIDVKVN
jgi:phage gpG-like protein